jgi:hypothetical protein
VNYMHYGATKQWYAVPGEKASSLERVMKGFLRTTFEDSPDLMHHMTTQLSPFIVRNAKVPVYKLRQQAGQFVVTFPKSFHSGFSFGVNCAEAVNFSTYDWLKYGREAMERYRSFARPSVFSHDRLVMALVHDLRDDWPLEAVEAISTDLANMVANEGHLRDLLEKKGVRLNVVPRTSLLRNNLKFLDAKGSDYDDKRTCLSCKQICFFSAVGCNCSHVNVSCLRCTPILCQKCPWSQKYLLSWHDMHELWGVVGQVTEFRQRKRPAPVSRVLVKERVKTESVTEALALAT